MMYTQKQIYRTVFNDNRHEDERSGIRMRKMTRYLS